MEQQQEAGEVKKITIAQIAEHTTVGDLWVVFNGKVYDVSKYMTSHPGGYEILMEHAGGKDATEAYTDADHTKRAREMVTKYYVGDFANE